MIAFVWRASNTPASHPTISEAERDYIEKSIRRDCRMLAPHAVITGLTRYLPCLFLPRCPLFLSAFYRFSGPASADAQSAGTSGPPAELQEVAAGAGEPESAHNMHTLASSSSASSSASGVSLRDVPWRGLLTHSAFYAIAVAHFCHNFGWCV